MNYFEYMVERNKEFAAKQTVARTLMPSLQRALPNVRAVIIGGADMRVDPAHVFGIKPGEAVVLRNIGGRITPGLLEQLGLLGRIGEVAGTIPGGGGDFHLIVLQPRCRNERWSASECSARSPARNSRWNSCKREAVAEAYRDGIGSIRSLRARLVPVLP